MILTMGNRPLIALTAPNIALTVIVLVILVIVSAVIRHHIKTHGLGPIIWRFISGAHHDGKIRTDAGLLRPGVRVMTPTGHTTRWAHRPRLHRAGIRWAVVLTIASICIGLIADTWATLVGLSTFLVLVLIVGAWQSWRKLRALNHQRKIVRPMANALAPALEMPAHEVRKALVIPVKWSKPDTQLELTVGAAWSATPARQEFIEREIGQRLPGVEWGASYRLGSTPRRILLTPLPSPPRIVSMDSVLAAIEATPQGKPLIGVDSRGNPVHIDLDRETPHIGLSIGTGGGKSDFLKLIIMQMLSKGVERIVVIDPKGGSQKWAEDEIGRTVVPGIEIYYDLEDQWQAIEDFRNRMEDSYRVWRSDRRQQFSREVLILEEQNDFAAESLSHWKKVRDKKDPTMPPPFDHTGRILFKGRQANRNVFSVYQRMSVQATGGLGDIRDQYGTKIMGRFSPSAWDSLVGSRPRGKSSTIPGRMITITGQEHRVIQAPYATDAEALDYVFSHGLTRVAQPLSLDMAAPVEAGQSDQEQSDSDRSDTAERPVLKLVTSRRTLIEHAERQTVPLSYKALSKRRQRDPGFPEGVNKTYTDSEIRSWYAESAGIDEPAEEEAQ